MSSPTNSRRLLASLDILFNMPAGFAPEEIEHQFLKKYAATHLWGRRTGLLLACVVWLAFAFWDCFVWKNYPLAVSDQTFLTLIGIRLIGFAALLMTVRLAFTPRFLSEKKATRILLAVGTFCSFLLALMMMVVPKPLNYEYYFVGIILVVFFVFGLGNLLTHALSLFLAAVMVMLVAQQLFFSTLGLDFFPAVFYFISFALMGWVVGVKLERNARDAFAYVSGLEERNRQLEQHSSLAVLDREKPLSS